jgi:L,D-peptidoglycan transpeptidase YkuD (ErfK/YbiS/YcfS/YnhG family)
MDLILSWQEDGARLEWGAGKRRAAIGTGGIGLKGGEGDGITPQGKFAVREILYRADRIVKPQTLLRLRAIQKDDGWCDAPNDPNYNRPVKLAYPASADHMWRQDHLYDLVAVLGYNDDPVVPAKGSAIFLHLAHTDYAHTQGCVALNYCDALGAITQLKPSDHIVIG